MEEEHNTAHQLLVHITYITLYFHANIIHIFYISSTISDPNKKITN